jgi:hypothetical protein
MLWLIPAGTTREVRQVATYIHRYDTDAREAGLRLTRASPMTGAAPCRVPARSAAPALARLGADRACPAGAPADYVTGPARGRRRVRRGRGGTRHARLVRTAGAVAGPDRHLLQRQSPALVRVRGLLASIGELRAEGERKEVRRNRRRQLDGRALARAVSDNPRACCCGATSPRLGSPIWKRPRGRSRPLAGSVVCRVRRGRGSARPAAAARPVCRERSGHDPPNRPSEALEWPTTTWRRASYSWPDPPPYCPLRQRRKSR